MGIKEIWLSIIQNKLSLSPSKRFDKYEKEFIETVKYGRERTFDLCALSIKNSTFEHMKSLNMDLVCYHDYGTGCCDECAKYTGRVYSVSGNSKYFPTLPKYAKKHGNFHVGCRCTMSPYFDSDTIYFHGERVNPIKPSNRPYKDYRTASEKQRYEDYLSKMYEEAKESAAREWDRDEYNLILEKLPDNAPKSFGAYRRMKNSNSAGFQKLQKMAYEHGIQIKK